MTSADPLSSLSVGNGHFVTTVDVTGLPILLTIRMGYLYVLCLIGDGILFPIKIVLKLKRLIGRWILAMGIRRCMQLSIRRKVVIRGLRNTIV